MPDNRPVDRLQAFLAAIAGDESAPELEPRDQMEYYLAKMAERIGNIQPGPAEHEVPLQMTANGYYYDGYADIQNAQTYKGTSLDGGTTPAYAVPLIHGATYTVTTVTDNAEGNYQPVAFAGDTGGTAGIPGAGYPGRGNIKRITGTPEPVVEQIAAGAYKITWTFTVQKDSGYMCIGCVKDYTEYAKVTYVI
jgi:hypothetical protein